MDPNERAANRDNEKEWIRESEAQSCGNTTLTTVTFKDTNLDKLLTQMGHVGFEDMEEIDAFITDYKAESCCNLSIIQSLKVKMHCQCRCMEHMGCTFGFTVSIWHADNCLHITNIKYEHSGA